MTDKLDQAIKYIVANGKKVPNSVLRNHAEDYDSVQATRLVRGAEKSYFKADTDSELELNGAMEERDILHDAINRAGRRR